MPTRVRAHPREGTRGVREHARQKPKYRQLAKDGNAVAEVWHVRNKKGIKESLYGVYSPQYGFVEVSEGQFERFLHRAKTKREIDAEIATDIKRSRL